ncbi:AMP binding protein [Trichosporon asahii var. asahii CBS 2479]|uniref:AMP binding protein n=1 Tax=Trichosporon asahii var. asahii (strain ATCC 90039 / CBS 2479 / JCM 2466 / KCTC 7840 / NBRC 103889/ NCYC 2677 / UAMH 7654) TaxID=1186058 RepID=J6F4L5_TRIAS|nr:AMP binding protein [Trichosporon asahii var. asahii CBS 2479]EJT51949.1 AMP binding protein [Trichosporon asahii var. asahii CBS 2479]
MASNPASRRNSISHWPEIDFSRPTAPPPKRVKEGVKIYDSPSPAPFLAQINVFDFLLPKCEGISPMPTYSGVLPAILEGSRTMSRQELRDMSLRLAAGLGALGVKSGDVGIVRAEGIEGSVALYALLAAGLVASPLVPDVDMGHQLADSRPSIVFVPPTLLSTFETTNQQLDPRIPDDRVILLSPPSTSFDLQPQRYRTLYDVLAPPSDPVSLNGAASMSPALRLYTPAGRAVILSHLNVTSQLSSAQLELGPGDVALIAPGSPFIASLIPLALGAAVTHSSSSAILTSLEDSEATLAFLPPPAISALLAKLASRDGEARELGLRCIISTGSPLHSLARRVEHALPSVRVLPAYATAETGLAVMHNDDPDSTVGTLAAGLQARLVQMDGSDAPLGPLGGKGELLLRGPSVSTTGHWHRTGDIASVRHGRWSIHGKIANRFSVAGTQVCPERLEALLLRHPHVRDAAVAGSEEGVRAHLVLDAGGEGPEGVAQHVMRYVQGRTRKSKWVRGVVLASAIPRTSAGLVRRGELGAGEVVRYEPSRWARL